MRALLPLLLALSIGCVEAEPVTSGPVDNPPIPGEPTQEHPCRQALEVELSAGRGWSPTELEACYEGCDQGDDNGYDQGRLACLLDGDYCPHCRPPTDGTARSVGYAACFGDSYEQGYTDEGCQPPKPTDL